jgi:hypothetical protein
MIEALITNIRMSEKPCPKLSNRYRKEEGQSRRTNPTKGFCVGDCSEKRSGSVLLPTDYFMLSYKMLRI